MGEVFVGTEAVAGGVVTRHELARWYRAIYPNVHVRRDAQLTLHDRTVGAWLWSKRDSVVTGVAASALHGAEWVDSDVPIELIYDSARPPRGIVARNERIDDDEIAWCGGGMPVASIARTAFDLGRFQRRDRALARMDALMRAAPFSREDVLLMAKHYKGARGVRRLKDLLPLVDGGAASPQESLLRLQYIDAGLPQPTTQVPIYDDNGVVLRTVDMAWEDFKVASEYDGDQHRTDRLQYVKDMRVIPKLERMGWHILRVIKEDSREHRVHEAWNALVARGWRPA